MYAKEINVTTKTGIDENGRKFMETTHDMTDKFMRRYLDHVETYFLRNLEQSQLVVLSQEIYEECTRRGVELYFFKER